MKRFLLAAITIVLAGVSSWAEFTAGSQSVAVFGGLGGSSTRYDYQPGDKREVTGGGGAFGAQYLYYLRSTPAIAIGADVASSANGNRRSGDLLSGYESTARLKSFVGMVMARLAFPRGTYRPYLFAGVGAHSSSQQLSAVPQSGNTWSGGGTESRMLIDERETSAALGYGIGMDVFASESLFLGVELRGTWLAGLDTDDTPALRAAGFSVDEKNGVAQGNLFLRAGYKF